MLEITVVSKIGEINFNNEELKKELEVELKKYDVVVTEDSIKDAKNLKAKLNNIKKAVDDERKRIKKEYCGPLDTFETQVKELTSMLTNGYDKINNQIVQFDMKELEDKKVQVKEKFDFITLPIKIEFEQLWEKSYETKAMTEKKIIEDFQIKINKISQDLDFIKTFVSDFTNVEKMQVVEVYKKSLDVGVAKYEVDKLIALKEKVKEQNEVVEEVAQVIENVDHAQEMEAERDIAIELLTRTFQVEATREQIIDLGNYMNAKNITFRKV